MESDSSLHFHVLLSCVVLHCMEIFSPEEDFCSIVIQKFTFQGYSVRKWKMHYVCYHVMNTFGWIHLPSSPFLLPFSMMKFHGCCTAPVCISSSKHHRLVITLAVEDDLPNITCLLDRKEDFAHKAVKENLILKLIVPVLEGIKTFWELMVTHGVINVWLKQINKQKTLKTKQTKLLKTI